MSRSRPDADRCRRDSGQQSSRRTAAITASAIGRLKRSADDPGVAYVLRRFIPPAGATSRIAGGTSSMAGDRPDTARRRNARRRRTVLADRRRQCRGRSARTHRHARRARADPAARTGFRETMPMMQGGVQLSLLIGPVPVPAPREVLEALTRCQGRDRLGRCAERIRADFRPAGALAAAHAVPADRRRQRCRCCAWC